MRRTTWMAAGLVALGFAVGCGDGPAAPVAEGTTEATTGQGSSGDETSSEPPTTATIVHSFGVQRLSPLEETEPCIQWTLSNEQPLYVNAVTLSNGGAYHHSNWFVIPEDVYPGPDGFFDCDERGFSEIEAGAAGTVLTAQSTQSRFETMQLPEGVVVKIPAHYKVFAGGHLLNLANTELEAELRMALDIIHPRDV